MKKFHSVHDVDDIDRLIQRARSYQVNPNRDATLGVGKRMGLLFLNPSLRTRVSTQIAASNLGLETVVLNADKDGWALEFEDGAVMNGTTVEHVKDAAAVLGQYFDVLGIRSFPSLTNRELDYQDHVFNSFATYSRIPVVSLESATLHPLQSLADAITVSETMVGTRRPKVVLAWAPHIKPLPQCVANSFAQWMGAWDAVDLHIAHPEGYDLEPEFTKHALDCTHNLSKAIEGADYVYFKNWSALEPYGSMPPTSTSWLLQPEELKNHARSAQIMHCLPVRRNVEVVDGLLDSAQSLIVRQARNRVWSAQAVLAEILERNG